MEQNFQVPYDLMDKIKLGNGLEIYPVDTLCIFEYDSLPSKSNKIGEALQTSIKEILEKNPMYKVSSVTNIEKQCLIFVVFDLKKWFKEK